MFRVKIQVIIRVKIQVIIRVKIQVKIRVKSEVKLLYVEDQLRQRHRTAYKDYHSQNK